MGDIYKAATKTIIYLGQDPAGDGANVASLVVDIGQLVTKQLEDHVDYDSIPELDSNDPLAKDPRWLSVTRMYQSAWFTRVWVVQEAALSREALIFWGCTEIPWAGLCEVQRWLLTKAKEVWFENQLFLNDLHRPGYWRASEPVTNFVGVLARGKELGCTDERDRIYGFLGSPKAQVGEDNAIIVQPKYEKGFREVYLEFGMEWLKNTKDLSLLSAVEHKSNTFEEDLPSWLPRWDYPLAYGQFGLYDQGFDASKGCVKTTPEFTFNSGLKVRGLIFDTIHFRSEILLNLLALSQPPTTILLILWNYFSETTLNLLHSILEYPSQPMTNFANNDASRLVAVVKRLCHQASLEVTPTNILLALWKNLPVTASNSLCSIWKHLSQPTTNFVYNDVSHLAAFAKTMCCQEYPELASKFHPNEAAFGLSICRQSSCFRDVDMIALERDAQNGDIKKFLASAQGCATARRFVITEKGYYGLAPQIVQEGDACCIVYGMCVPVILRKIEEGNGYKLVGEAFMLGLMNGEVIKNIEKWGLKEQDIILY